MNVPNQVKHLYNLNGQLSYDVQYLRQTVQECQGMIQRLQEHIYWLSMQNNMLHREMKRMNQPINIEKLHLSHDINLDQLRVNSIQSGAALNIGEWIRNGTNSDMDMEMGANSNNSGDCNEMLHCPEDMLDDENKDNHDSNK